MATFRFPETPSGEYRPESGHFKDIPLPEALDALEDELACLRHEDEDTRALLQMNLNRIRTELKELRTVSTMHSIAAVVLALGVFLTAMAAVAR